MTTISSSPVPRQLYIKSRPRAHPSNISPSIHDESDNSACRAASHLRFLELFFLVCTVYTPLIGAYYFGYIPVVLSADSFSWSNSGLFSLAAGLRTWSHLIHYIQRQITDLHNTVHGPSPDLTSTAPDGSTYSKIQTWETRMLERAMVKMNARVAEATQGLYEYVGEAVGAVDRSVKKQGQRCERQAVRVREVVDELQGAARSLLSTITTTAPSRTPPLLL